MKHKQVEIKSKEDVSKQSFSKTGNVLPSFQLSSREEHYRNIGNQAVLRMLESQALKAKLKIGSINDKRDHQANQVAESIVHRYGSTCPECLDKEKEGEIKNKPQAEQIRPLVQREKLEEEDEEPPLLFKISQQKRLQLKTLEGSGFKIKNIERCPEVKNISRIMKVAIDSAKRMVSSAINSLCPDKMVSHLKKSCLKRHFHIGPKDTAIMGAIKENFIMIKKALDSTIYFNCPSIWDILLFKCYDRYGYVDEDDPSLSDIYICSRFFIKLDSDRRAMGIIHEMSHKYAGTFDIAYEFKPLYKNLSAFDALYNADSYAHFARDVNTIGGI